MIELSVYNGNIEVRRPETLTSGRIGHKIHFSFDKKWSNLINKFANFECGNLSKTVKLPTGDEVTTAIPVEVLQSPGYRLKVGVKGLDENLETLIPTKYADLGIIHQGSKMPCNSSSDIATEGEIDEMLNHVFSDDELDIATEEEISEMLYDVFNA